MDGWMDIKNGTKCDELSTTECNLHIFRQIFTFYHSSTIMDLCKTICIKL